MKKICKKCNSKFETKESTRIRCYECSPKRTYSIPAVCEVCGKDFVSRHPRRKKCYECHSGTKPGAYIHKDYEWRPPTPDTEYLLKKWHKEGMTPSELSRLTKRPVEQVLELIK